MSGTKSLKALLAGLNEDLAAEYSAIVMYTTYAAEVDGIHRNDLKAFFQSEIPDEQTHAQILADKIVALGGRPTTESGAVKRARSNRERLENALVAEEDTLKRYTMRLDQAEAAGELGTKLALEDFILDETKHRDELRMMLRNYKG